MSIPDSTVATGIGALAVWLEAGNPKDTTLAVRIEVGFGEACGKEFLVPLGTADEPTSYLLFVSMGLITGRWMFEARRAVPAPVPEALQDLRKLRLGVPYQGAWTDVS